jgi:pimeloyl-ACP methyl ester carboxylesterase
MSGASGERGWMLLHGTPLAPAIWGPAAEHLDGPVAVPDCTVTPAGPNPQATTAARLAEGISGDIDLVGHSFGGQTALELALLIPERVRSLTVLCSRDTPVPAFAAVAAAVRAGTGPTVEATLRRWFAPEELAAGGPVGDEVRAELATASVPDWAAALDAIARYDSSARTPGLRMPVTLVAAGGDAVSTPDAMRALQSRIPHADLIVHDAWHHLSPFLDPAALAALLTRAAARGGHANARLE